MNITDLLQDAAIIVLAATSIVQGRTIATLHRRQGNVVEWLLSRARDEYQDERLLRTWLDEHEGEQ